MPSVDEQLSRALREAAPRPTTSGLDQRLARRRRARAARRRVGTAALAIVVLVGTAAGFLALSDAFEGDRSPRDPSPTLEEPTPTPPGDAARSIPGVPFAVCRVTELAGTFGEGLDTVWVFEEEHTPGWGCDRSEGFQHLAVGSGGRVEMMTRRLTDVLNDDAWRVWAFAAPDLNDDGIDEIAIARQGGQPDARHLWLFRVTDGGVVPITEECGRGCDLVEWNIEIGPTLHENGVVTHSGLTCALFEGRDEERGELIFWQADTEDPLHVYLSTWRVDGGMLDPIGDSDLFIQGTPGVFPPSGLDELCGSAVSDPPTAFGYTTPSESTGPFGFSREMCRVQPFGPADVNGDGREDTVFMGVSATDVNGCPEPGREDYLLGIDIDGDRLVDLEDDSMSCEAWCSIFALVDLSGDGKGEILVNEGHTAAPASAVIAVYQLAPSASSEPYLQPVRFPDGTNRFPLVNSASGWYGAYCTDEEGRFTTWEIESLAGVISSITFHEYRMDDLALRFELLDETTIEAPDADFPPKGSLGYDGLFCRVEVETPG